MSDWLIEELLGKDDYQPLPGEYDEPEPKALGGPGSGNFGHAGRPGQVGGSSSDGSPSSDLAVYIDRTKGTVVPVLDAWGREKKVIGHDFVTSEGKKIQLKGRELTKWERENQILYHVTTNLDAVLESGELTAFEAGGGLGGGNHPAVSFTTSREDALNIISTLSVATEIAHGADVETTLRRWSTEELKSLAREKYPPKHPDDGPLDAVPMDVLDKVEAGIQGALRGYKLNAATGDATEAGVDALRTWLWSRETLGLGKNPVLFTRAKDLRRAGNLGILVVPGRAIPNNVLANVGADGFQSEVEVHGDVPITQAYYLSREKWNRRTLRALIMRILGGPGSGNFDHAGRPGEVGGSSTGSGVPKQSSVVKRFNMQLMDYAPAQKILVNPKTGVMILGGSEGASSRETHSGVYFDAMGTSDGFDDFYRGYLRGPESHSPHGSVTLYTVRADVDAAQEFDDFSRILKLLKTNGGLHPKSSLDMGSTRTMNALQKMLRTLGGPGSGNFGHAGRPGQVGGSSSDAASQLANAADEFEQPEWYSPGDNQTRVVWDLKAGDTIPLDKPSERGIEGDFDQLGAIHTGDTDYWTERLSEDYNRDASEAKVILIRTDQDDVLIDDPQYAMDPEGGDKATANVLLTARKELKYGVDWVFDGEEFSKPEPLTHNEWKSLPADPDYVYHATSAENARDIANDGLLTHDPSFGTEDQDEWPDGIVEDRSYFIDTPSKARSFAPAEGKPVLLRVRRDAVPLKRESTGDFYTTKPVAPDAVTIVTADKRWVPLGDLKALGGPGSGNFGHAGRPGQVGGSSSAGGSGGDEDGLDRRRNELTKYGEVANQIELDYAKLRNQILFEMSTKYADDVAVDITQLTDEHPDVIKAKAAYDDSAAKYQKMFDAYVEFEEQQTAERRRETVIRRTTETLEEMGLDPTIANVVDKDPREFEVGGQTFHEAGHYNPNTGMIEINARNGYDVRMSVTRGLVAHEATHAMYDRVKREWAEERTAYNNMSNEDIEKIRMDGTPKPEYVEEFAKKYPISTEMDKVWGFKLQEQMIEENGHTNYAKAYWDAIQPGRPFVPGGLDRAVNETLAEIMSLRLAPKGYPAIKQPSQKWQDFATTLHKVYLDIRAKDLAYMAEAKKLDS